MGLFGDLEKQVLDNVLGGSKQPSKKQTMKSRGNKQSKNNNVKDTITNDLLGIATENIKKYTPDSVDKIVDDVAGTLSK